MSRLRTSFPAVIAFCGVVTLAGGLALAQSDFSVTLNGAPLALNPPPQERAGRVFVPLRGVFEQLGASVVYQNGTINAQGNGRAVSLQIGSTQALVDGQPQTLDVAPFIIGASTYVPLRFVSQALGATVNYDASNRIVALTEIAQQQPPPRDRQPQPPQPREQPPQQAAQRSPLTFVAVHPGSGETVDTRRPTVEADFGNAQANANSIRIDIDGVNVTDQASRSSRGVVFSPPSDLQSGQHTVIVSGTDANGQPFDTRWNFVSGTNADTNSITNLRPGNGANVRDQFTVSGRTTPGARVVVQIGTADRPTAENFLGQLVGAGNGSVNVRSEVTADGNGNFQAPIDIQARQGQALTMVVDSTDARTSAAAPRIVRNLTAE